LCGPSGPWLHVDVQAVMAALSLPWGGAPMASRSRGADGLLLPLLVAVLLEGDQ
jgi:hypothetical protein